MQKVATKIQSIRYMYMMQEMIKNMLGDYAKYVTPLGNGQLRVHVPKDLNNPSLEEVTTVDLSMMETIELMNICMSPKSYSVNDGSGDKVLMEGDEKFDINKWATMAIGLVKHKK